MDFNRPFFKANPAIVATCKANLCPTCDEPVGLFRDELSKREYNISGMCQKCQDSVSAITFIVSSSLKN